MQGTVAWSGEKEKRLCLTEMTGRCGWRQNLSHELELAMALGVILFH